MKDKAGRLSVFYYYFIPEPAVNGSAFRNMREGLSVFYYYFGTGNKGILKIGGSLITVKGFQSFIITSKFICITILIRFASRSLTHSFSLLLLLLKETSEIITVENFATIFSFSLLLLLRRMPRLLPSKTSQANRELSVFYYYFKLACPK